MSHMEFFINLLIHIILNITFISHYYLKIIKFNLDK